MIQLIGLNFTEYHDYLNKHRYTGCGHVHHFAKLYLFFHHFCVYSDPVISPYGYVFDREAVLEYYLEQKKENARKLKEWEKQCKKEEEEAERVCFLLFIKLL